MKFEDNEFIKLGNQIESQYIKEWKVSGNKVVGYYCANMPEEIAHAAGLLPYRIRGIENKDFQKSDAIMSRFNCTFIRSTLNLALNGKYDFLDGLMVANTCDHVRRMFDIFKLKVNKAIKGEMPLFFLSLPHKFSNEGWQWTIDELNMFSKSFRAEFNIGMSDTEFESKLSESLKIYKKNQDLINQLDELRSQDNPLLSGTDFFRVLVANSSVRKEYANSQLEKIIKLLKTKGLERKKPVRARLMVIGSSVDNPDFLSILEHAGAAVITDNICTGISYYNTPQIYKPSKVKTSTEMIAEKLYSHCYCPRMMNGHDARLELIKERLKNKKIDGVILQRIEFCDLHGCENSIYSHELNELGVPTLDLDREYFLGDTGRLRTRVEAFLEKIGGGN